MDSTINNSDIKSVIFTVELIQSVMPEDKCGKIFKIKIQKLGKYK